MSAPLNIVVASCNPVKISAVREAFTRQLPSAELELISVDVKSGVSDQPDGDQETRQGARNRVEEASRMHPDADYWVGLEGGVDTIDDQLMAFAWMVVRGSNGRIGEARTATLPLPPSVKELVASGVELGDANDRVFSTVNSKQAGGAFGLLTDGLYTREGVYREALIFALVPFVNELFSPTKSEGVSRK
jgi:inosine/xanthosine triphosphatase